MGSLIPHLGENSSSKKSPKIQNLSGKSQASALHSQLFWEMRLFLEKAGNNSSGSRQGSELERGAVKRSGS